MTVKKGKQGSGDPLEKAAAKARKRWNESRTKKDGFTGGLEYGAIADGDYPAKLLKAAIGVTKKGEGDIYISLDFVFIDPENEGTEVNIFHDLKDEKSSDAMARTLKRLDFEIEELDPLDLKDIVANLNKEPPMAMLQVANKDKDSKGNPFEKGPRAYVNVQKTIDAPPASAKKATKKKK
jgi:hypothetical protein